MLDFSRYMNKILAIDEEARTATVEPGITVAALNRTLAPLGLMLGPDPSSADRATVGGSTGNNASGSHSILYGMMVDHVLATDAILADGSRARFEPVAADALAAKARGGGLEGAIYAKIPVILQEAMDDILLGWPKHWRRSSGYNLDRLAAPLLPPDQRAGLSFESISRPAISDPAGIDHFNLAQLLAGSQGQHR